jgi:hypothetical protein
MAVGNPREWRHRRWAAPLLRLSNRSLVSSSYCPVCYCLRPRRHCTIYIPRSCALIGLLLSPRSYSNDELPYNQVRWNSLPIRPPPTFDVINIIIFITIIVLCLQCEMLLQPLLAIRKNVCGFHVQITIYLLTVFCVLRATGSFISKSVLEGSMVLCKAELTARSLSQYFSSLALRMVHVSAKHEPK